MGMDHLMSTEENKAVVRRAYEEGMNLKNLAIIDEVFAPYYRAHFPGLPPIEGVAAAKELIGSFLSAFPDIIFTIEDQVAEGDKVVARWSAVGTHLAEFRGFPPRTHGIAPTGRKVSFSATDIYVVTDGRIVEEWNTLEQLDVMQQLGVVSSPD
jgi:predicted ester cyclase